MKQTRQAVRAVKQSIFLDVYGNNLECYGWARGKLEKKFETLRN